MSSFQGGTATSKKGYLVIKAGPCRDMAVHTLVAEAMLGRKLRKDEEVNHKDGNKQNPRWDNLQVVNCSVHGCVSNRQKWFLKNREESERKQWEDWINTGENKPDD